MKRVNKFWGSALIAAGALGLGFLYFKGIAKPEVMPREKLLGILNELREKFKDIFQDISNCVNDLRLLMPDASQHIVEQSVMRPESVYRKRIREAEEETYRRFNVRYRQFRFAVEDTYKEDEEVARLQKEMRDSMTSALNGKYVNETVEIPDFLTPELTLGLFQKFLDNLKVAITKKIDEIHKSGELEAKGRQLKMIPLSPKRVKDIKIRTFQENGMASIDGPEDIFMAALNKYSADATFTQSIQTAKGEFSQIVQRHLRENGSHQN